MELLDGKKNIKESHAETRQSLLASRKAPADEPKKKDKAVGSQSKSNNFCGRREDQVGNGDTQWRDEAGVAGSRVSGSVGFDNNLAPSDNMHPLDWAGRNNLTSLILTSKAHVNDL